MPWSFDNPPPCATNWPADQKRRCVAAANAALADGKSERDAIIACIGAAGKPASVEASLVLRLAPAPRTPLSDWQFAGSAPPIERDGSTVPVKRYKKAIAKAGMHVKMSEGVVFHVKQEHLGHWVVQFQRMRANGVGVPIPATHQPPDWEKKARDGDPRDNMGWVDDLWVEGDTLWMACRLIGTDAIVAAHRGDVSINSPHRFTDGKGNLYVQPITHVCMCTDPVILGLGEFIPIAASMRAMKFQGEAAMLEFLQKLGAALGLDPAAMVDEATAQKMIFDAIEALMAKVPKEDEGEAGPGATPPASNDGAPPVRKETITRQFSAGKSAAATAVEVSPLLAKTVAENRKLKIDSLVTSAKITKAQADKLKSEWSATEAVTLTLSQGGDGSDFDRMIEILDMGAPLVRTGERTGAQSLALSDGSKGNQNQVPSLVADAERRAKEFNAKFSR